MKNFHFPTFRPSSLTRKVEVSAAQFLLFMTNVRVKSGSFMTTVRSKTSTFRGNFYARKVEVSVPNFEFLVGRKVDGGNRIRTRLV